MGRGKEFQIDGTRAEKKFFLKSSLERGMARESGSVESLVWAPSTREFSANQTVASTFVRP